MVVIYSDAVDSQSTVMIILDTALITHTTMMYTWHFVYLALVTEAEPPRVHVL